MQVKIEVAYMNGISENDNDIEDNEDGYFDLKLMKQRNELLSNSSSSTSTTSSTTITVNKEKEKSGEDCREKHCAWIAKLSIQYRMNEGVMKLANHLIYQNCMKSGNDQVR